MAEKELVLFESEDKTVSLSVPFENETVWLNQRQMIDLFERNQSVISRHIKNVFEEGEVEEKSNMHFLHNAFSDKPVAYYSLDVIISVGYRVKSKRGIEFRKWANKILKQYILKGYAANEHRLEELRQTLQIIRRTEKQRTCCTSSQRIIRLTMGTSELPLRCFCIFSIRTTFSSNTAASK